MATGLFGSLRVSAHGGEDHGDEGKSPAPAMAIAPRALAQSDDFELVAVLDESPSKSRRLLISLDEFKTNQPVVGARLEMDVSGQNISVQEQSPGVYEAQFSALDSLEAGGRLPLTISVETDDSSDLLTTVLVLPTTVPSHTAGSRDISKTAAWVAGALLAFAATILLIVRRRHFLKRASS